ncbi:MAG: Phosphate regulon sensor protein PhoR [Betaproteobacteria bacterium ADurb.Bin341]|nr:MAG: Phosphate regulon sensor protein PhoR [Betaproteobacteria bacterium ADurb.Bin341]
MSALSGAVLSLLFSAVLALAVGWAAYAALGWAVLAAALFLQLLYHLRHFVLLERWSRQPTLTNRLQGSGVWDEVLARLYRHQRAQEMEVREARHNANMYVAAGQALIDGLMSLDAAGHIEWCNASAEEMLGLNRRSDLGQPLVNLVRHPQFVQHFKQGDFRRPLTMPSPADDSRVLSLHVVVYGGKRKLIQVRDITQSCRLDEMRRDFVANVSHELRTPLTVLSGFIETLAGLQLDEQERQHYLKLMAEQSIRMQRLLDELLILSNLESSPPPPATEQVNMTELTAKVLRDAQALSAGRHRVWLEKEGEGDLLGSEAEIASALSNLVSNAVRYTPEGGEVRLLWQVNGKGARFTVEDTGIGIDAKHLPRLTERFYRVDRSRSRETGGTGLGLSIVKHALQRHQGHLEIESTLGKGSRFIACFPLSRVAARMPAFQIVAGA